VYNGTNVSFVTVYINRFQIIMIMMELTGEGRACIPVGLTKTQDGLIN